MTDRDSVSHYYRRKFTWLDRCLYCGEPSTQLDHVFPVSAALRLDLKHPSARREVSRGLVLVPSCEECNQLAGDEVFLGPLEKRVFIQAALRKRYWAERRRLVWDEDELEDLGPSLRSAVERSLQERAQIELRLTWPRCRTVVESAKRLLGAT